MLNVRRIHPTLNNSEYGVGMNRCNFFGKIKNYGDAVKYLSLRIEVVFSGIVKESRIIMKMQPIQHITCHYLSG